MVSRLDHSLQLDYSAEQIWLNTRFEGVIKIVICTNSLIWGYRLPKNCMTPSNGMLCRR